MAGLSQNLTGSLLSWALKLIFTLGEANRKPTTAPDPQFQEVRTYDMGGFLRVPGYLCWLVYLFVCLFCFLMETNSWKPSHFGSTNPKEDYPIFPGFSFTGRSPRLMLRTAPEALKNRGPVFLRCTSLSKLLTIRASCVSVHCTSI